MPSQTLPPRLSLDPAPLARDTGGDELAWLALLDELYGLADTSTDADELAAAPMPDADWPSRWQPVIAHWAEHIGARAITLAWGAGVALATGKRTLTARLQAGGVGSITASSDRASGFTPRQARQFHAFCSHLQTTLGLQRALVATRRQLAALHGVIDALPLGIVVLDEHLRIAMLNRHSRSWLAEHGLPVTTGGRLQLPAQQAAFAHALQALPLHPGVRTHHLQLDGLDLKVRKLHATGTPSHVLVLIHEHVAAGACTTVVAPPDPLACHLQHHHGLTAAEVRLAWNVAQGMPPKTYAALSSRSLETTRVQLKSVFRKLEITGQKGIGPKLFDALHAVTLRAVGMPLAALAADDAAEARASHGTAP